MSLAAISPAEALRLISGAPGATGKTPADLRKAAKDCEHDADRKDRLEVGRIASNRRKARARATAREADKLRAYVQVCELAADEIERRKAMTVGDALRHPFVRLLRRLNPMARRGAR